MTSHPIPFPLNKRVAFGGPTTNPHQMAIALYSSSYLVWPQPGGHPHHYVKHFSLSEHFLTGEGHGFQELQVLFLSVLFSAVCQELTYAWVLGLASIGNSALKWQLISSLIAHSSVLGDFGVLKSQSHSHQERRKYPRIYEEPKGGLEGAAIFFKWHQESRLSLGNWEHLEAEAMDQMPVQKRLLPINCWEVLFSWIILFSQKT